MCINAANNVVGFRVGVMAGLASPHTERNSKRDMQLKKALHELDLYLRVREGEFIFFRRCFVFFKYF